jgi:hypothetical protein
MMPATSDLARAAEGGRTVSAPRASAREARRPCQSFGTSLSAHSEAMGEHALLMVGASCLRRQSCAR